MEYHEFSKQISARLANLEKIVQEQHARIVDMDRFIEHIQEWIIEKHMEDEEEKANKLLEEEMRQQQQAQSQTQQPITDA